MGCLTRSCRFPTRCATESPSNARSFWPSFAGGAILLGAGCFAVSSGRAYLAGDALTDRLHDAQRALLALELSLSEAESGARGYLLTGRQDYLRPYERALG